MLPGSETRHTWSFYAFAQRCFLILRSETPTLTPLFLSLSSWLTCCRIMYESV